MTAGTFSSPEWVQGYVDGYSNAAVVANQFLIEKVFASHHRIGGVQVHADTAGTGGGNTVVDVLLNGTSIYAAAGDKPTLAATSTGAFASNPPSARAIAPGDRLAIQVSSISTTGHARLKACVTFEKSKRGFTSGG